MATRILGPTGSRRRRRFLAVPILLTMVVGLMFIGTAAAVHDEAFELDGNIAKASPAGGPEVDWDDDIVGVAANGFSTAKTSLPAGFGAATAGPDFTTTIRRGVEVAVTGDDTTFTTNSKDILDISAEWRCVHANNVTDKGDLVNTYAVAYVNAANELILYFGAEKNDASGTNNLGVWFLQDPDVDCTDTQGGSGTAFQGDHVNGDILVVSEFTGGGSTATITAYRWDDTAVNNLVQLGTSGICGAPGTDDRLCAITNVSNQVNPPWKTWDKDTGSLDVIDTQQFYEGAINVSAFGLNPCLSTMLTDTRSSVSTTATLYDFARREFNVCNSKTGTKFHDLNANGIRNLGESGLSGWTINLYPDTGTKGSYDGEPVLKSDVTDANGAYEFANLFSGDYIVCEDLAAQTGWFQSAPTSAPSGETLVTNCPGNTKGYAFTMGGADRAGNDFGNFQQGAVSGTKFKDANDNGAKDSGEIGLSGWKIHIYDSTGTEVSGSPVTTTALTGDYSISLNPGSYTVCEEITDAAHTGWVQSYPAAATAGSTSCASLGGILAARGWSVSVVSQGTTSLRDFGNTPLSKVKVDFLPQATLPDGTTAATHATSITCTPGGGNANSNTFTTSNLRINQGTTITCTITYVDP
jgi:hypothetical protein